MIEEEIREEIKTEEPKEYPVKLLIIWACDCAERSLKKARSEGKEPDSRSWKAVEMARLYLLGAVTEEELKNAEDAAWDARTAMRAAGAAWVAAGAAAGAVWAAMRTAWDAAWDAARAARAAADAARAAAEVFGEKGTPEREAEEAWQERRFAWLLQCWEFAGERALYLVPEGRFICPENCSIDFELEQKGEKKDD